METEVGEKSRSIPTICGWSKNNLCKVKRLVYYIYLQAACRLFVRYIFHAIWNKIRIEHFQRAFDALFYVSCSFKWGFFRFQCEPLPFNTAGILKYAEIERFDKKSARHICSMWQTQPPQNH